MNGSLFSITRYMNRVCFKVSGGTSVPKLPPSYPPPPRGDVSASIDTMIFTLSPPRHFVENNICGKCPHALTLVVVGSK